MTEPGSVNPVQWSNDRDGRKMSEVCDDLNEVDEFVDYKNDKKGVLFGVKYRVHASLI